LQQESIANLSDDQGDNGDHDGDPEQSHGARLCNGVTPRQFPRSPCRGKSRPSGSAGLLCQRLRLGQELVHRFQAPRPRTPGPADRGYDLGQDLEVSGVGTTRPQKVEVVPMLAAGLKSGMRSTR
jgi:hypothetical protein